MKKDFANDASLPDGPLDPRRLEMRAMLDEPIGQKYIGLFAKEAMTQVGKSSWSGEQIAFFSTIVVFSHFVCSVVFLFDWVKANVATIG